MVEKTIDLTGTSANSIEDAVAIAVARAAVTISGLRRARITDTSAVLEGGRVVAWKVDLKVTFEIEEALHE